MRAWRGKVPQGNEGFLKIKRKHTAIWPGSTAPYGFDGVMYIAVVVIGAIFMVYGRIGAPDLVAYLLYVSMLLASVRRIVEFTEQFQRGMTGIERFLEIMDSPIEVEDAEDAVPLPPVKGKSVRQSEFPLFGQQ